MDGSLVGSPWRVESMFPPVGVFTQVNLLVRGEAAADAGYRGEQARRNRSLEFEWGLGLAGPRAAPARG